MKRTFVAGGLAAVLSLSMLLATPALRAQSPAPAPTRAAILSAAHTVVAKARYAALVSLGEDGQPQARIVDPFPPDSAFTVWIGTNARSRKVAQLRRDGRVTLLYFDRASSSELTILGRAELVTDPAQRTAHFKKEWAGFYKGGPLGDDYLLIRVRPARLEIVSPKQGMTSDPVTWKPVSLDLP